MDEFSVSLNASNSEEYDELSQPKFENAYEEVKKFIKCSADAGIETVASIVDGYKGRRLDVEKCRHLFEILDSREGRKSTVLVSQIPVKEWYDLFKDCTYADACLDRVLCKAYRLEFKGESLRN